ncbi:MAG: cupin domain-containing protein [Peptococcaceae bacterium]|nr:cupin domain-containing protein [Peptococcaceae bacterium]
MYNLDERSDFEKAQTEPPCYEPTNSEPPSSEPPSSESRSIELRSEPPSNEPFCHEPPCYAPRDPYNPYTYAYPINMMDYGPSPFSVDIYQASLQNHNYRTALWTGSHLQTTLMCIPVCDEIGLEVHPDTDQFFCVAGGQGMILIGEDKDDLSCRQLIGCNCGIFVPAGTWHNIINTGNTPLSLYTIYAPPHHPWGTVHMRKADAIAAER